MTLIIDFSNLAIAACSGMYDKNQDIFDMHFFRKAVLGSVATIRHKFVSEGLSNNCILACDGGQYWRRDIFPYYKAGRKDSHAKLPFDYAEYKKHLAQLVDEIRENVPLTVMKIPMLEADDIVATMARALSLKGENVVISATDSDFLQLQRYKNIRQWNPRTQEWMQNETDPDNDLLIKTIKGDRGDGIPNIMSDDDAIVHPEKRQVTMSQKRLSYFLDTPMDQWEEDVHRQRFERNKKLIDFREIPREYQVNIIETYNDRKLPTGKLFNYLASNQLELLIQNPKGLT